MTQVTARPEVAQPLRVAIMIGNEVLGRGVEALLQSLEFIDTVKRFDQAEPAAPAAAADGDFDVLIVSAGDADALAGVPESLAQTGTRVLALVDENTTTDLSLFAGISVDGFLSQQELRAETLREALHRASLGELPMPPALARALLARAEAPPPRTRAVRLTSREVETLALLVRGMSNKQIARRLAISSHGAKRLVASIMLKLDSPNRTTAVVNAIKAGIVDYQ